VRDSKREGDVMRLMGQGSQPLFWYSVTC